MGASPLVLETLRAGLAGRYEIDRELGHGGMAVVYLARDLRHDRQVALKILRPELSIPGAAERFHREITLAARLVHPNILPVLESGETAGLLWFTMPFVEGESLRSRLDREHRLPVEDAVRLTCEIAGALSLAHEKNILHRDIKPDNILLTGEHALVADFGIARALGRDAGERITGTGIAMGTPGYMSPEQSSGDYDLDARTDQYALASVSYEMLAGEPPFTGPSAQAVIARRMSQPPPSVRVTRDTVPARLDAVLRRALSQVPDDRFPSTAEFSTALAAAASGQSAASASRQRWMTAALLLAAATIAMVLLLG
jgi:serine/threonine-protein kinase